MEWIDDRLRMRNHPNESLANLDRIEFTDFRRLSINKIWNPDLQIGNRLRGQRWEEDIQDANIDFEFGAVSWNRIYRTRVTFEPDVRGYPYDIQAIKFLIASETYKNIDLCVYENRFESLVEKLILKLNIETPCHAKDCETCTSRYMASKFISSVKSEESKRPQSQNGAHWKDNEWQVIGQPWEVFSVERAYNYPELTYVVELYLKRNHPFYTFTLILPIGLISALTPIGLILPSKSYTSNLD